jgi:hypothetical protein
MQTSQKYKIAVDIRTEVWLSCPGELLSYFTAYACRFIFRLDRHSWRHEGWYRDHGAVLLAVGKYIFS